MKALLFKLRKIYRGLLWRGQKRIIILSNVQEPQDVKPIFIIGCQRSGTSLLRRIVDSHSSIACPPESHFLLTLLELLQSKHSMCGLESMGFPKDAVLNRLQAFVNQFFSSYAQAKGKLRWADKTPQYIDFLNAIDELYQGQALYIMLYRHGLDVAYSLSHVLPHFVEELPNYSSVQKQDETSRIAAAYWREQVLKMRSFQTRHFRQCFEMRYESLVQEPARILPEMFNFLGEKYEDSVLHFNDFEHDEGMEDGKVVINRGFVPSIGNYRKWQPAQLQAALEEAGPLLSELDYSV